MNACMNATECMDGWMDGWMDGCLRHLLNCSIGIGGREPASGGEDVALKHVLQRRRGAKTSMRWASALLEKSDACLIHSRVEEFASNPKKMLRDAS